jgi:hypothetical protein
MSQGHSHQVAPFDRQHCPAVTAWCQNREQEHEEHEEEQAA